LQLDQLSYSKYSKINKEQEVPEHKTTIICFSTRSGRYTSSFTYKPNIKESHQDDEVPFLIYLFK